MKTLETVIYEMVEEASCSKTAIATRIGKPLSTLSREVSPYDEGAKLGVETLVPLMLACSSLAPLHYMAASVGMKLVQDMGMPDGDDMHHECLQGFEAVADYLKKAAEGAHYTDLSELREKALKELDDVYVRAKKRDTESKAANVAEVVRQ